ncbi:LapA family protein [Halalkalibacterium ligniniphilum]|uniref:LapA family protein n=1 Tax=Halalkalibacterium ligniniphilum TaxID=1134413 RepID=UPI000348FAD7|nr:lipopolysaccharide assembly LapA domain-containing protein [Halalkalibacterium ligniniphilum]
MRGQWGLILGLVAAILIAIFAVINVDAVQVNYLAGTAEWPLILVILGSVLMGSIFAGGLGMVRIYKLQAEIRRLKAGKELSKNLPYEGNEKQKGDAETLSEKHSKVENAE